MSDPFLRFRRAALRGVLLTVVCCHCRAFSELPLLAEPDDVRLLLRAVQRNVLPLSNAVTQDVGVVVFEPADEPSSCWFRTLGASFLPNGSPVLVFDEAGGSGIAATNLATGGSAFVESGPDELSSLTSELLEAFAPDVRDALAPYFDPSLVSIRFFLVSPAFRSFHSAEPGELTVPAVSDFSCSQVAGESAIVSSEFRGPISNGVVAPEGAGTNAPTRAAIPTIRRLVCSGSASGLRLSLRNLPSDMSVVDVSGVSAMAGLDVRGKTGVVRLAPGAVLSAKSFAAGPRRALTRFPSASANAIPSSPTGSVLHVSSPRQDPSP